jgi:hypothetical protein
MESILPMMPRFEKSKVKSQRGKKPPRVDCEFKALKGR